MRLKVKNIRDVAEYQLCCGCGACAYISPDEIEMVDTLEYGRRPLLRDGVARDPRSAEAMHVCPGIELHHTYDRNMPGLIRELEAGWGPVLEVWEGHAADPEIRFAGSSGGAASALALFSIERLGFHGVLHIASRPDVPYLNHTVLSTTRAEILERTGSRYAPASPCDGLQTIEDAPGPCVFIGKPCDVAAVEKARRLRPALDRKIGLTIAIFCAGTPTTRATLALLEKLGNHDPSQLLSLRYRGNGWPGRCTATFSNGDGTSHESSLSYEESWGLLTHDKQWRCHLCPDHTGEFADIAVGDPWDRPPENAEPGRSLVLARTDCGRDMVDAAIGEQALTLAQTAPHVLVASQPNLLKARGALWGRLLALRLLLTPRPDPQRIPLLRPWLHALGWQARLRALLGTVIRYRRRRLGARRPVVPVKAVLSEKSAAARPARRLAARISMTADTYG